MHGDVTCFHDSDGNISKRQEGNQKLSKLCLMLSPFWCLGIFMYRSLRLQGGTSMDLIRWTTEEAARALGCRNEVGQQNDRAIVGAVRTGLHSFFGF